MSIKPPEPPDDGMNIAIHSHASRLHRRFRMVDREDIVQEMYLWWYTHPRKVQRYLDMPDNLNGRKKLSGALRNYALAYCHKEKARQVGYEVEDLYFYSITLLKELLPAIYDEEAWVRLGRSTLDGLPSGKTDPAEGNNMIAALTDVSRAVKRLPRESQLILELAFQDHLENDQLARLWETTEDAARMRVNRVLRRVQEELGGERPRWADAGQPDDHPVSVRPDAVGDDDGAH